MFMNVFDSIRRREPEFKPKPFKNQIYEDLKELCNKDNLFEDPEFPAIDKSIYYTQSLPDGIVWKRPHEVMENPQFEIDGFSRTDLDQGKLGNCWFIAACMGIMQSDSLFNKVVPKDQSFKDADYSGIFHFRFWLYGEWIDVVIDDRLPFFPSGRLVFCHNKKTPNELWGPLLEKAYAKIYGSYEALEGGFTTDALIDMSGGIEEYFDLKAMSIQVKEDFFNILLQSYHKNSIIGCNIHADLQVKEARLANGLVKGHAYTVTKVAIVQSNRTEVRLVRCRNPWGNEVEWKGEWSDGSKEWDTISAENIKELGQVNEKDGEFWMNFVDFIEIWDTVQICHLTCDSLNDESDKGSNTSWRCTTYQSEWLTGVSAGGCGKDMAKYWTNPQFMVTVEDVDKYDNKNKASLIVALMQKDTRIRRIETFGETAEEYIQFRVFKIRDEVTVDLNKSNGLKLYSNQLERIDTSGNYINKREVTKRIRVAPGNYVIIPSTYDEDRDCKFMLRVFTENPIRSKTILENEKKNLNQEDIYVDSNDLYQTYNIYNGLKSLIGSAAVKNSNGHSNGNKKSNSPSTTPKSSRRKVQETCSVM